jgi:hypothetical protein
MPSSEVREAEYRRMIDACDRQFPDALCIRLSYWPTGLEYLGKTRQERFIKPNGPHFYVHADKVPLVLKHT